MRLDSPDYLAYREKELVCVCVCIYTIYNWRCLFSLAFDF
jgi:hypothetical protein